MKYDYERSFLRRFNPTKPKVAVNKDRPKPAKVGVAVSPVCGKVAAVALVVGAVCLVGAVAGVTFTVGMTLTVIAVALAIDCAVGKVACSWPLVVVVTGCSESVVVL